MAEGLFNSKNVTIVIVAASLMFYWLQRGSTFAADGTDPGWDAAVRQSEYAKLPTVVLFTAGWCPSCRALHVNVLSRRDVQEELRRHYTLYTVDLTNAPPQVQAHAQKLGVSAIPTLIRYDANQKETDRTHNMGAEQMIAWLKAGE